MNNLRSEKEIRCNWDQNQPPLVTIRCNTYNHEAFIEDAIVGFLIQETNFPFEVVIHDDASTDRTPEIISEYKAKYSSIIKAVLQKENQRSKGIKPARFTTPLLKGEYFAICEGDDYWTDKDKLQIQMDQMLADREIAISFHSVDYIDAYSKSFVKNHRHDNKSRYVSIEELILGDGGLMGTQSIVYRRDVIENQPDFYNLAPAGDYTLTLKAATRGRLFYIDRTMACYRSNNPQSLMGKYMNYSLEKSIDRNLGLVKMFLEFNIHTKEKYSKLIKKRINSLLIRTFRSKSYKSSFREKIRSYKKGISYFTLPYKMVALIFFLPLPFTKKGLVELVSRKKFRR